VGIRSADHATPYQLKLELTSPTGCGRSVGIIRLRTKTTEFFNGFNEIIFTHINPGHLTQNITKRTASPKSDNSIQYVI
jgi:hypothetical protein